MTIIRATVFLLAFLFGAIGQGRAAAAEDYPGADAGILIYSAGASPCR